MAGEIRGLLLEAWVVNTIQELLHSKGYSYTWDKKFSDLAVKPDILIFGSNGEPLILIFVTWAGSRTDVKQKFWRNMGELVDVLLLHPKLIPISISAIHEFSGKENEVFSELTAQNFAVTDLLEGQSVVSNLLEIANSNKRKMDKEKAIGAIRDKFKGSSQTSSELCLKLELALNGSHQNMQEILLARKRLERISIPVSRKTTVKLAVGKLVLAQPKIVSQLIHKKPVSVEPHEVSLLSICEAVSNGIVLRASNDTAVSRQVEYTQTS